RRSPPQRTSTRAPPLRRRSQEQASVPTPTRSCWSEYGGSCQGDRSWREGRRTKPKRSCAIGSSWPIAAPGGSRRPTHASSRRHLDLDRHRRVVAGALELALRLVDRAGAHAGAQRLADQDMVDAQALVLAEREVAVIPPTPELGRLLQQAEGIVQAQAAQRAEVGAF